MRRALFIYFPIVIALLFYNRAAATHIKAGEIIFERTDNFLVYDIILIVYTDSISVIDGNVDNPDATIVFGDGTSALVSRQSMVSIGNATYKNVYVSRHAFPAGSALYRISYTEENRNASIKNMINSVNTPFYIESSLFVSPAIGANNSPALLFPPIDQAEAGEIYVHNPGAFDLEGDSISFKMTIPRKSNTEVVTGYKDPDDGSFGAGSVFSLNPVTGDMTWDTPLDPGLYNVAFQIEEWRNNIRISFVTRDMQIEVLPPSPNDPPVIVPMDTCVVAGSHFSDTVVATDPNNDKIYLTSSNVPPTGVYDLGANFSLINGPNPLTSPAKGVFSWTPDCQDIRVEPYFIIFKAEDARANGKELVDVENYIVKVTGPAPELDFLTIENSTAIRVHWKPYACPAADSMLVYRKDCSKENLIIDPCEQGLPQSSGYEQVGSASISSGSFLDQNNVQPGAFYCYVLVAKFPLPQGGLSRPSNEECSSLNVDVTLLCNVSVTSTDSVNGNIFVKWISPKNIPLPGPYEFRLFRAAGLTGEVFDFVQSFTSLTDTFFTDSGLNTLQNAYRYKVEFYNNGVLHSVSIAASSPFLKGTPGDEKAFLTYEADVPWRNELAYIYKGISFNSLVLYDSIAIDESLNYTDVNVTNCDTFYYKIELQGRFCDDELNFTFLNNSQVVQVVPVDSIFPNPPVLSIAPVQCSGEKDIQNELTWIPGNLEECNSIKEYVIYYGEYEDDTLKKFISTADTFYFDIDTLSLSGCYTVTAVNVFTNESGQSNKVCLDNCFNYQLPNLITPNKDELNDIFVPIPPVINVEKVTFFVYNRWGKQVHFSDDDIFLNWEPGELPDGVYFFMAEVKYRRRLRREEELQIIKGWVQIIR